MFHACTFDDLMTNEKSFRSEIRDTSKNVADAIFNHLIGCKCPEFRNGFWISYSFQTDFRKWLFETLCLDSRFNNHPDSVILQKCQSLSNQNFKHNLVHTSSLNLTPSFFLTFITQKQTLVVPGLLVVNIVNSKKILSMELFVKYLTAFNR